MKLKALVGVLAVAGLAMPGISSATNGYFSHGYGMTAKGMGGAATAMSKDTFGGANNPASMVFVGDRMDVGVDWFRPIRSAERAGGTAFGGSMNGTHDSGSEDFAVPEFGFNMMMGDKMSFGVTVYGNGGMNSDYEGLKFGGGTANMLGGTTRMGVDLLQLVIAPTFAYKLTEQHSVGVSPLIGYQRFKAEGLQGFNLLSHDASYLTNQGYDNALGYGVRLGYMGKLNDMVTVGAAYSSKIKMSSFDKYRGLFAEQGDFDMPENWNVGIAIKPIPSTTIALDYQRINYSDVKAIANPSTNALLGAKLGNADGPGFGWGDVEVLKLGVEYAYSPKLTLRAGVSKSDNPIQSRDVTFNILAPGVVTDHYTLGFTYGLGRDSEITMSYMHAKENSVTGDSLLTAMSGGVNNYGTEKIKMYQDSLGIAYGMKF
ncbi:MAG: outer membrane protein transport protein [Gammaproteobacteria bacterium]|nr:outer membrane protein transport protein [Gammaproteobacteria bacterium]MBU1978677.1 outer membrane protein transport protein [Gammaproteobacteria bacterium]